MVRITNGKNEFEVTRGAFDGIYSRQGYVIVEEEGNVSNKHSGVDAEMPAKNEDDNFVEEIIEKPISQWNKDETKRFAALKGIDISGTKNVNEAKEIIKLFLSEDE